MTNAEVKRKSRNKRRDLIRELKSQPCSDCGGIFPPYVMDFDHVRGEKEFNIGTNASRVLLEALLIEVGKCDVVCSNCHRIRTHEQSE